MRTRVYNVFIIRILLKTSVICESAVHGGVVSDGLGGRVSVTRGKGLRFYESTFANGVLSKSYGLYCYL